MFSLEKMRKLQKQFKSKVQSQNLIEPEYTSLAEIIRNRHRSIDVQKKYSSIGESVPVHRRNEKNFAENGRDINLRNHVSHDKKPLSSKTNLIQNKKQFFSIHHKRNSHKSETQARTDIKMQPIEKMHKKVLRNYAKDQMKQQRMKVRNGFYENLGRLQNKDTRDAGLRNLEKIMSENCDQESLKVFLNCLAASNSNQSQIIQDNEVLVLGKLVETFRGFFDVSSAILSLVRIRKNDENVNYEEEENDRPYDIIQDPSVTSKIKNISKVLDIIDKKMRSAENETSEALAIVFSKLYLLSFIVHEKSEDEWIEKSNFFISKVHHNLYKLPGIVLYT
jgi:hypothetical protein